MKARLGYLAVSLLIISQSVLPQHPRLLFTEADTAWVRQRAYSSGTAGQLYRLMLDRQARHYSKVGTVQGNDGRFQMIDHPVEWPNLTALAFAWYVTRNDTFLQRSKEIIFGYYAPWNEWVEGLLSAPWPNTGFSWGDPDYRVGALAIATDIFWDVLTEQERADIFRVVKRDIDTTGVYMPVGLRAIVAHPDWIHQSNHLGRKAAGLLAAAIVFREMDEYREADSDIELAKYRVLAYEHNLVVRMTDPDGASHESVFYGPGQFGGDIIFMKMLGRHDGVDYVHTEPFQSRLRKASSWFAYEVLPAPRSPSTDYFNSINDSYKRFDRATGLLSGLLVLGGAYADPLATWVFSSTANSVDWFMPEGGHESDEWWQRHCPSLWFMAAIMLYDDPPSVPDPGASLPLSRHWKERGLVYIRSSTTWADNSDIQFAFEGASAVNPASGVFSIRHDQPDKNGVTLSAFGEDFIEDIGYHGRWPQDQNTVFIDGKGQAIATTRDQNGVEVPDWPLRQGRIVAHNGGAAIDFIHGDAKEAYGKLYGSNGTGGPMIVSDPGHEWFQPPHYLSYLNPVVNADRYVMSRRQRNGIPHYFVIADDIRKSEGQSPHLFEWHFNTSKVAYPGNPFLLQGRDADVRIWHSSVGFPVLSASQAALGPAVDPFDPLNTSLPSPGGTVTRVKIGADVTVNPYFHLIILPSRRTDPQPTSVNPVVVTNGSCWRIAWSGYDDYSIFRHSGQVSASFVSTDGKLANVRRSSVSALPTSFVLAEGTFLTFEARTLVDLEGVQGTVFNEGDTVYAFGAISSFRVYAPSAVALKVNGTTVPHVRDGDYIGPALLAMAETWQALSAEATATNSQRKIVRQSTGRLHVVFESGGHIFSKNSNKLGGQWNNVQLTSGAGVNSSPCVTERGGAVYVCWHRRNGASWEVQYTYSLDNGSTWLPGSITLAVGLTPSSPGPTPVIQAGSPDMDFELMAVYRTAAGLVSRRTTVQTPGEYDWGSPVWVDGSTASSMNPSLAFNPSSYGWYRLVWEDEGRIYHENYYSNSWGYLTWVSAGAYLLSAHAAPSVAVDGNHNMLIAWDALYGGRSAILTNRNLSGIYDLYYHPAGEYIRPSATGHAGARASVFWHDDARKITRALYPDVGSGGGIVSGVGLDGFNVSASIQNPPGGTSKILWSEGTVLPLAVHVEPTYFSKPGLPLDSTNSLGEAATSVRWLFLADSGRTSYVGVGLQAVVRQPGGYEERVRFSRVADTSRGSALLASLGSEQFLVGRGASIRLVRSLLGRNTSRFGSSSRIRFEAVDGRTGQVLASTTPLDLPRRDGTLELQDTATVMVGQAPDTPVRLRARLENLPSTGVVASVVNVIAVEGSSAPLPRISGGEPPTVFALQQNYPNPFNPSTSIRFDLPAGSLTTLTVYDVLGRRVGTLVDEVLPEGSHARTFNAAVLASGVYFYRLEATPVNGGLPFRSVKKMLLLK